VSLKRKAYLKIKAFLTFGGICRMAVLYTHTFLFLTEEGV